jgi:hypothetical protein
MQGAGVAVLLASMALLPVVAQMLPALSRPGVFFGVTVDPGFGGTKEGRRVLRRFRRQVWVHFVLSASVAAAGALRGRPWLIAAGILWQTVRMGWAFWAARRDALPHAVPEEPVREATLAVRDLTLPGGVAGQAGPFLILAAAALWLRARWDDIPERFPIHWDLAGTPNGWSERTVGGVYGPLLMAAAVALVLLGVARRIVTSSRDPSDRSRQANLAVLLGVEYLVAAVAAVSACLPLAASPGALLPALVVLPPVVTAALVVYMVRVAREVQPVGSDGGPDRHWKGGLFYVNRGDPALLVPKRSGMGYTLNYGRPLAWILTAAFLALLMLPSLLRR